MTKTEEKEMDELLDYVNEEDKKRKSKRIITGLKRTKSRVLYGDNKFLFMQMVRGGIVK